MKYGIYFFVLLLIFACKSKNQQQNLSVEESVSTDSSAVEIEETDDSVHFVDSVGEIKTLIFREFQEHQGDSTYSHFTMLIDKEETIFQSEIRVGNLFHPKLKSAVLSWSVTDSTMDLEVFHFQNESWKSVLKSQNLPATKGGTALLSEFLLFSDYNHDGWNDLEVIIDAWDGVGYGHRSRLWLVDRASFVPVQNFEEIYCPEIDFTSKSNLIYSYYSGGCADMAMHFAVWKMQNNSVQMIKEIDVDCCVGIGSNCAVYVNEGKPIAVPGNKVHLYVPKHFQEQLKSKMQD